MKRTRSVAGYAVLAAADAVLAGMTNEQAHRLRRATKPLLMPVLAMASAPMPPLAATGLALSGVGDIALLGDSETVFMVGLASFLAAHGSYIVAFGRDGGYEGLRKKPWKMLPALGLTTWSSLSLAPRAGQMRWPVTVYGVVIGSMAALAAGTGRTSSTWGAATFCLSDLMLATSKFTTSPEPERFSITQAAVMVTYTVGQALIIAGLTDQRRKA